MNKINGFSVYREYWELITLLTPEEQKQVAWAILNYMFDDKEVELNERENKIFINLKRPLEKSKKRAKNGATKKTNENQNEIKKETKTNQNEIKTKSNENQNNNKKKSHQDVNVIVNVNNNKINNSLYDFIEENFGRTLSPIEYEEISTWKDNELTRYAIKETVLNGKYNIKYIKSILNSFEKNNIQTVQQAQEETTRFKAGNLPEWFDKNIKKEKPTEAEEKSLKDMLKEFT